MRTVFLGSPPFALPILERLIASDHRPVLVVTPPDRKRGRGRKVERSPVAALAEEHDIPVFQPETVRSDESLEHLRTFDADVFAVASYGEFLPKAFVEIPHQECLNVHPSLLPRHRGATPVQASILAGDEITGVSIQRVAMKIDAGDIVEALETPLGPEETAAELSERLAELGATALLNALDRIANGTAEFVPQDEAGVTLCTKLTKEDGRIEWSDDAREIVRRVLAMNPWPGARTTLEVAGGKSVELGLRRARFVPDAQAAPGTVLEAGKRLVIAAKDGAVELIEVQPSGKRAMAAADFCRGARLEASEVQAV